LELLLGAGKEARDRTVFSTDIVFKQYSINPIENGASFALNTFFARAYKEFPHRIFIGLLEGIPNQKIKLFSGESMREWVREYFWIIGRIPSIGKMYKKMSPREARKRLGIENYSRVVTVLFGWNFCR
jgi:hypothetical protein